MARHSKWHKVRQFKGAIDAKRAASFTKLAREITMAAREKGGDPATNASLKAAIAKARSSSLPKDNIERAIQRGIGGGATDQIEALTYEAFAPGGVALIIECLTDNRHRTANDVKHLLSKNGATLASTGAVTHLFDHVGVIHVPAGLPKEKHDELELALIDAGATDIVDLDGPVDIYCIPSALAKLADTVDKLGLSADSVSFEWIPKSLIETDEQTGNQVADLIDTLDEHDDVSKVFSNMA